ncbi:hypothetical protein DVH05_002604 [Phytophthora capsici]|nr:hypothetical protein DVH05_002604 [Phytophthora capsici]
MKRLKRKHPQTRKPTLLKPHARRIRAILPLINASGSRPSQLIRQETIFGVRQSVLHFHAAASHAEMCSEYIAIICSTSIFYFLQHHPRFGWHEQDGEGLTEWKETLITGSWQIGIEMVVDFTCCVVELANGIPLQASESLGGFLAAVFTTCALVAVSISTILCAHEAGSTHM